MTETAKKPIWRHGCVVPLMWFFGILAAIYFVYTYIYPTFDFNYRLTIEVETPEGVKTGSTVNNIVLQNGYCILIGPCTHRDFSGEAIFIDLGGGKNLIFTLTHKLSGRHKGGWDSIDRALPADRFPLEIFDIGVDASTSRASLAAAYKKGRVDFPLGNLPTTVTFTDLNEPKSVLLVNPLNLEATFGPGYRIIKATIELTHDPITENFGKNIPWWNAPDFDEKFIPPTNHTGSKNPSSHRWGSNYFSTRH